jgi:predicted ATP-grasp superfamily ATP-dependent carboligase
MEHLRWERRPKLRRPIVIVAFEGWNDAGDAATLAVGYLATTWGAERFATIDPEEFYDFTTTRPQVELVDGATRSVEWPEVELLSAAVPGTDRDVILVRGVEPQLRWRTFCDQVVQALATFDVDMTVILGALLADVPHTRPVRVTGNSEDSSVATALGVTPSTYEGPTGIVGILHHALSTSGVPVVSFWAAVPHYVHQVPSPKAALALLERSAGVIGARIDPLDLRVAADEYVRQVSERVADDDDAAAYVAQLEEADDNDLPATGPLPDDPDGLADEVEQFLRQQPGQS